MSDDKITTRRDFIRGTTIGALGIALGCKSELGVLGRIVEGRARVVLIRHPDAVDDSGNYNDSVVGKMLDEAVTTLFEKGSQQEAWSGILQPNDILGIKTNVWGHLATPQAINLGVKKRAMEVGIPESNISIRDRGLLNDPIFTRSTALVNARPLRIHHWSGIGGCLKNYIMFVSQPWAYHGDSCADLGKLWKLPVAAGKTRLNILVVLNPHFHGIGPHNFSPRYTWPYGGLMVGTDPVALDSTGLRLLQAKQKEVFGDEPQGYTSPKHVGLAETRHGIGIADPDRIDIVRLGWTENSLI